MNFKTITIGKRILVGLGSVLILLLVIVGVSFIGFGGIVTNIKNNQLDGLMAQKEIDHLNWVAKVNLLLADGTIATLDVQTDDHKCSFGKWLYGEGRQQTEKLVPTTTELFKKIEKTHSDLHASAVKIGQALESGNRSQIKKLYVDATLPALHATQSLFHDIRAEAQKYIMDDAAMMKAAASTRRNVVVLSIIAVCAGLLAAFFIVRNITTILHDISAQIDDGAEQVAASSQQIASGSHDLSQGVSEQASSLEETSASLEEIASMTKQNADNASQADGLMQEAKQVVDKASTSMEHLIRSMHEISQASEDTSRVIKTIDEIAFQTNLLALNAAVEASRAGEAGAGFAVVADEVRKLAMRAAEAARNTADLIETTIARVTRGTEIVAETNDSFGAVAQNAEKAEHLVAEIAAACHEQSQGISQVSTAVSQMDSLTQQLAASAEKSAGASEELSAQAGDMDGIVKSLLALVDGTGHRQAGPPVDNRPGSVMLSRGEYGN